MTFREFQRRVLSDPISIIFISGLSTFNIQSCLVLRLTDYLMLFVFVSSSYGAWKPIVLSDYGSGCDLTGLRILLGVSGPYSLRTSLVEKFQDS